MKTALLILSLLASQFAFAQTKASREILLTSSATQVMLTDAQYELVPTQTVVRPIPGCHPNGEASVSCDEVVVIESRPIVKAHISYIDTTFISDGNMSNWTSVNFEVSDFSAEEVAALKAVYPPWQHPGSQVGKRFAAEKMSLKAQKIKTVIEVVDMDKSKFCPINLESGDKIDPNCQDQIVYKESWTHAVHVKVDLK